MTLWRCSSYDEISICGCDDMMTWGYSTIILWYLTLLYGHTIIHWYGDEDDYDGDGGNDDMMIWRFDDIVVWWSDDMVILQYQPCHKVGQIRLRGGWNPINTHKHKVEGGCCKPYKQ